MLSHRIISSAHFKKMPISSQALYFHLCMEADDDGVVEAWPIMQISGFAEDDIKVLVAKELVSVLNEDLVTYIRDWREHNLIRADHKVDSMYKDLLLKVLPDVELVRPEARSDVKNNSRRLSHNSVKRIGGQSTDSPRTSHGQSSIGKVSEGKVRKDNSEDGAKAPTPAEIARSFFQREESYRKCLEALTRNKPSMTEVVEVELDKFILYWTEPNKGGTKVRWEQEATFEVGRRLKTWLDRVNSYQNKSKPARQAI